MCFPRLVCFFLVCENKEEDNGSRANSDINILRCKCLMAELENFFVQLPGEYYGLNRTYFVYISMSREYCLH